jgi:3,4-dihydroxy 2-butanone 4-phosphate synthase/GTP cyclohydrolase II
MPQLMEFGRKHQIRIVAVADIIKYRMRTERVVKREEEGVINIPGLGTWRTRLYRGVNSGGLHMAIYTGELTADSTMARVQGSPPAWSFLGKGLCKSATQAHAALHSIHQEGSGALILMHLDGASEAKVRWAFAQDFGGKGDAPVQVQADALRDLGTGCQILLDLGLRKLKLLTNSARAIVGVEAYGLEIVERIATKTDFPS